MWSWLAAWVALGLCGAWFWFEHRGRERWRELEQRRRIAGPDEGPYRPAPTVPVMLERAPTDVRAASVAGVLVVQLLLVAMVAFFGVFAHGAGPSEVSSLAIMLWAPSLVVASRLLRTSYRLLQRRRLPAGLSPSNLAIWALLFYGALGVGMLVLLRMLATMVRFPAADAGWSEFCALGLLLFGWPLLALAASMAIERVVARHGRDLL